MPAPSVQISTCALTLRPVAARVVSYGRSNKMAQRATLYVLRVSRGGREWFVARRFSEFRALDAALRLALASPHGGATRSRVCAQCRELARRVADVSFPSRFPIRSSFASSREKIESARLQQLDAFVQLLMETTQGLLANQDDEYDEDEEETDYDGCGAVDDGEREDRCDALRTIREFLLVHDHLSDDKKQPPATTTTNQQDQDQLAQPSTTTTTTTDVQHRSTDATTVATKAMPPPQRRPRLTSSSSLGTSTTTFRVQELDAMYRPASPLSPWMSLSCNDLNVLAATSATATTGKAKSSSPNVLDDHELDALFLADYASPAVDAVIHRQLEVADMPATHVLRRAESMRTNRWGL